MSAINAPVPNPPLAVEPFPKTKQLLVVVVLDAPRPTELSPAI
jgi:hypothetical protein